MPESPDNAPKSPWYVAPLVAFAAPVMAGLQLGGFVNGEDITRWSDFEFAGLGVGVIASGVVILWQDAKRKRR